MSNALLWLVFACSGGSPTAEGVSSAPDAHDAPHADHAHADAAHRFDEVDRWVTVFDDPSRDGWQRPQDVVDALALRPGMAVADIGAGTGYFNARLAAAVGAEGRVIAVDIEASLIAHMQERATREGTPQVTPRLGAPSDPGLKPAEVDRLLIVNTYHHIADRVGYFKALRAALRPDGRLVVVDFEARETAHGPPASERLPFEVVLRELDAAGWRHLAKIETLPEQYLLVFDLPDQG